MTDTTANANSAGDTTAGNVVEEDLNREERLARIDRMLRWAPRDRSRRIRRMEAIKTRVDAKVYAAKASEAEARYKARRFRWVPFVGAKWREAAKKRTEERKAAEAEAKYVEYRLTKARESNRRREEWAKTFAPHIAARQELRAERDQRIAVLGTERLEAARRGELGPYADPPRQGSAAERRWITEQGRAAYRQELTAERDRQRRATRQQREQQSEQSAGGR